jgi:RNA recognition motif-containing protein
LTSFKYQPVLVMVFRAVADERDLMGNKLYVGNLSERTTEADLQALFAEIGPVVSATLSLDAETGNSRLYGLIEMATEEAAETAVQSLDGYFLHDQKLMVNKVRLPQGRAAAPAKPAAKKRPTTRRSSNTTRTTIRSSD